MIYGHWFMIYDYDLWFSLEFNTVKIQGYLFLMVTNYIDLSAINYYKS